jgi:3-methyladenine DNA glycosylase AlkD
MTTKLRDVRAAVRALADPLRAVGVARFFKTGKGEYGEGDKFLGLYVPQLRAVARDARELSHEDTLKLLASPWHEERVLALMILVDAHERAGERDKTKIHRAYLANTAHVNNWDLVDLSARELVGYHVARNGTRVIERLARSTSLWERRIAMIATFYGIPRSDFAPALLIAERLLDDEHDLIHKAVGWMLREVGKRDVEVLRAFLSVHATQMPRTALRYAIERLPPNERKRILALERTGGDAARPRRVRNARSHPGDLALREC